jgi:hypothetical protein
LTQAIPRDWFSQNGFRSSVFNTFPTLLWSWRDEFGSDSQWADVLGQAAIAAGGKGFWAGLTERQF